MVPLDVSYSDVYTDTFIFFPIIVYMCKIIWINVHDFPNAPRIIRCNFRTLRHLDKRVPLGIEIHCFERGHTLNLFCRVYIVN